jgi:hypothetical protein
MKRHAGMITGAIFIMLTTMSMVAPLRIMAQPGTVTISGQVTYQPRNWNPQISNWALGKEIQIDLYEKISKESIIIWPRLIPIVLVTSYFHRGQTGGVRITVR